MSSRNTARFDSGFTLLEMLIGSAILAGILVIMMLAAKSTSTSNMQGRDLSTASMRLNTLVDSLRGQDPGALTKNSEQVLVSGNDTTRWMLFDSTSSAPYTQISTTLLLCAKYSWKKFGVRNAVETSTLLSGQ